MEERLWIPSELPSDATGRKVRLAETPLWDALTVVPVVVVTGPRQSGKSTLVRAVPALRGHQFVTLEDLPILAQAREAPGDLTRRAPRLILDNVLYEAPLMAAVRDAVDEHPRRRPGHFVLVASADPLRIKRVHGTLAGRAAYVRVWPMTRRERSGLGTAGVWNELWGTPVKQWFDLLQQLKAEPADWKPLVWRGGYPTPALELGSARQRETWFGAYLDEFLMHDLEGLAAVEHIADFRRLMRVACRRIGNVMNKSEMAREAGLTQPTAHRYLSLMETSYQLIALEAYAVSRTRSLVKSSKAYWSDTGFAMFLAEENEPRGAHLENMVLCDLVAWRDSQPRRPRVTHWRTRLGEEVDFVVERGDELLPIEVTPAVRPQPANIRGIRAFKEEYGERVRGGLVIHAGQETFWITQSVLAVPWWRVV